MQKLTVFLYALQLESENLKDGTYNNIKTPNIEMNIMKDAQEPYTKTYKTAKRN